MDAMAYMPLTKLIEVTISGSDPVYPWLIPAGTFVEKVIGRISTALDAGTLDIGDEDNDDEFIANSEWTETNANVVAVSTKTTAPAGGYYPAAKKLKVTPGTATTAGVVQLLITYWELGSMTPNMEI